MKFNKKLWKKFYSNRIYAWDLVEIIGDEEIKVHRRFRFNSEGTDEFMKSDKSYENIPPLPIKAAHSQIKAYLNNKSGDDAFILARRICQKNKTYKLRVSFIIKSLIPI